ncbi:MAG: LuxR C-terminal-related transcriptional regulator [Chitinophagales bacterium]|nr:LuxR C-terminal-related transcriptional regulator [Chitinophagales bacterium]
MQLQLHIILILFFCCGMNHPLHTQTEDEEHQQFVDLISSSELAWSKSLRLIDSAILAKSENGQQKHLASLWNLKGNLYSQQSNFNAGFDSYKKSLKLYQQIEDHIGIGNCYINFGRLTEDKEKQLNYYRLALSHFSKVDNNLGISKVINNIGVTHEESDNLDSAIFYFQYGLDLAIEKDFPSTHAACLTNLGNVEISKGNCQASLIYLDSAEVMFKRFKKWDGLTYNYGKKGEAYLCLNEKEKALQYFLKQNELAQKQTFKSLLLNSCQHLKSYYETEEKWETALHYANQVISLEKEIEEGSKLEYTDMMYYEMEVQKKNRALEQIQFQQRLRKIWIIAVVIVIALIFIIILLLLFRLKGKVRDNKIIVQQKEALITANNQKHEQEIRFKNRELRQLSNYILQKKDFVELVKKQVMQIKKLDLSPEISKKINQALVILNGQLNLAKDNEILQAGMEEMQKKFLLQLKNTYPQITTGDMKLLSLLAIDLTSKEIAELMGISTESVHTKRYRLRKKLNMPSEMTFNEFLQKRT